jgi:NitT/TauT family transport system permease protein
MATSKAKLASSASGGVDETLPDEIVAGAHGHWLGAAALFVVLIGIWEGACRILAIPPHLLPTPSSIAFELYDLFPVLLRHTWVTTIEVVAGFLIAAVVGVALAVLVDRSAFLRAVIHPYVIVLQATPKVALAPFLIIWFGFGITSKIAMAALITFFPIFVNTVAGFVALGPRLIDLMTVLRASPSQVLWKVKIPFALPYVFAGLEIGILLSLIGAIVGEFVSATAGLGYLIANYNFQLKTASAFAALVMLVLLGLVSYGIVLILKRRIVFWLGNI